MASKTMVKKVLSVFMTAVMLAALSCVFCFERAYAETENDFSYTVYSGFVEITGYSGLEANITVPARLGGRNVYSVTGLCSDNSKSRVKSVTFSNGIKLLGKQVLSDYTHLERVTLPNTLTSIGDDAFFNCFSLAAITFPSSLQTIGTGLFTGCSSLLSADLTSAVKDIPLRSFEDCSSLMTLILPPYLNSIGDYAFHNCSALKTVILPNGVQSLGTGAFQGCKNVTNINMPTDLKSVGELAFDDCHGISSVFLPGKIKSVGDNAFRGCSGLTEAYISPSIELIGKNVFSKCVNLQKIVFGGSYLNINNIFDIVSTPTVYYPSKNADSWMMYSGRKSAYDGATSISVSGSSKMTPGKTQKLTVTIAPRSSDFNDVYYLTSSNTAVATVAQDGTVTARFAGSTVITATAVNGKTGSITILVTPDMPTSLKVTAKSTSSAELTWKGSSNATGYVVYRSSSKNGTYKKLDTVLTETYIDKGLSKGKTYYYKVAGYVSSEGAEVTSEQTKAVSVTITSPAPKTVSAKKASTGAATIKWSKATGASGYEVYMATSKKGKYTKVATLKGVSKLSFKKTGLTKNKTYYFKVRSYVTVGSAKKYSAFTKVVSAKV